MCSQTEFGNKAGGEGCIVTNFFVFLCVLCETLCSFCLRLAPAFRFAHYTQIQLAKLQTLVTLMRPLNKEVNHFLQGQLALRRSVNGLQGALSLFHIECGLFFCVGFGADGF